MRRLSGLLVLVLCIGLLLAAYGVWLLVTPDHPGKAGVAAVALVVGAGLALVSGLTIFGRWPRWPR